MNTWHKGCCNINLGKWNNRDFELYMNWSKYERL